MTRMTLAISLAEVKAQVAVHPRTMIRPSVDIKTATLKDRQKITEAARRVIDEHRDVLVALKDR